MPPLKALEKQNRLKWTCPVFGAAKLQMSTGSFMLLKTKDCTSFYAAIIIISFTDYRYL
jgi:hypothetical protein